MARIKKQGRRYGHGQSMTGPKFDGTHLIKLGHKKDAKFPQRFPGFMLMWNTLGNDGNYKPDIDSMAALGYSIEQIEAAYKAKQNAEGLLPHILRFFIPYNAVRDADGSWAYPKMLQEVYQCWDKRGLLCEGDGEIAFRREEFVRSEMQCHPVGKVGVAKSDFCPLSVNKQCKPNGRLVLGLFRYDNDNTIRPVSPQLGMEARFRIDTTSEMNTQSWLEELDKACDRLGGIISGLPGVMTWRLAQRRTGQDGAAAVGIVPQVDFRLDEGAIRDREERQRANRLEDTRTQALLLNAPPVRQHDEPHFEPVASQPITKAEHPIEHESHEVPDDLDFDGHESEGTVEIEQPSDIDEIIEDGQDDEAIDAQEAESEGDDTDRRHEWVDMAKLGDLLDQLTQFKEAKGCQWSELLKFTNPETQKAHTITRPGWFAEGDGSENAEKRIAALRQICHRLVDEEDFGA